jgi:UDP-N-acetylmuramyl pentapeptide synthase
VAESQALHTGDLWVDWGRRGGVLSTGQETIEWEIPSMAPRHADHALELVRAELDSGKNLRDALTVLETWVPERHVLDVQRLANDVILVDDTATLAANDAVASLKTVTSVTARSRRIIVVAGPLVFNAESDYDSLGSYGALMVRLNIDQVFAVGADARALFLSVGMEGSWDGESQHCLSSDDAYDEVRTFVRPEDVVLVMGSLGVPLLPIAERLGRELS